MSKRVGKIIKKSLLWISLTIVALVIVVPALLYIPAIQNSVKDYATGKIKESTGMDVSIDYLRLHFPLNLAIDGLTVKEASGDTMITARHTAIDVALLPLFASRIDVKSVQLDNATYRLGTPDSTIYMVARIDKFETTGTGLNLSFDDIDIGHAMVDGADVSITLKETTTVEPADTTASFPMTITADDIELRNISYRMSMLPAIDSLGTYIGNARLHNGVIDMSAKRIDAESLTADSITATYLTPPTEYAANPMPDNPSDSIVSESAPWLITVNHIRLTSQTATYAMRGTQPSPGLDMNYIQASRITIEIDSFYNHGTTISVPLRHLSAIERCGLAIDASGVFAMDSTTMQASDFSISTPFSHIDIDAAMGIGDLTADTDLPLRLQSDGLLSLVDIKSAIPAIAPMIRDIPLSTGLMLHADINGTSGSLDVHKLQAELPRYLRIDARGHINSPMDFNHMNGNVKIDGTLQNVNTIKPAILSPSMARQINIPPTSIKGNIDYKPGLIAGDIKMSTGQGHMMLHGKWNNHAEGYDATLSVDRFPTASFMPSLGVGDMSLEAHLNGHGYNPASPRTAMMAHLRIGSLLYQTHTLTDIILSAQLDTCRLTATIESHNRAADLNADLSARFSGNDYEWDISGDIHHIDLEALKLTDDSFNGSLSVYSNGRYSTRSNDIETAIDVTRLDWNMNGTYLTAPSISATLSSADSLTHATFTTGDIEARLNALCPLDSLISKATQTSTLLTSQISQRNIDVKAVQKSLPAIHFDLKAGSANMIAKYLEAESGLRFNSLQLTFNNDSLLSLQSRATGIASGDIRLDDITFDANQHGRFLVYKAAVDNRPGTMDDFAHIQLSGYMAADKVSALFKQSDIKNEQGFHMGMLANVNDSTVNIRLVPYNPTIAYKKWSVNHDNSVTYNFVEQHLDANLKLMSDSSYLHLYTEHDAGLRPDSTRHSQEDVVLKLANINLAEWLSISPFAPPIKGDIDADMRFRWTSDEITGNGTIDLNELYYGRERVGTFTLDVDVANDNKSKALHADVGLMVDHMKVITASGVLNDSTAANPFLLDFSMIHFPLRVLNPFLPKDMAQLSGMLNGRMDITGDMANPIFNGYLDFDSTAVKVGITGASYRFSEAPIPVDSNMVRFNDFMIAGLNGNNLHVNGIVDCRRLSDISLDLGMTARDMQIVNSSKARGANVYGKAFIDIDATAKGNMQMLNVDARLNLLAGTNVTYVLTDAESVITSQKTDDMVRFVQFADTAQVFDADTIQPSALAMNINANLRISEGATINADLSTDGKNKVSVQGNGNFTYTLRPQSDGRLTGRLNIDKGFARYSPPLMSEKNFSFSEGSYVAFTGDMMNPTLNIKAVDRIKANVTQTGQNSRLVNFDVTLSVGRTLQNMDVAFDLSTDEDLTIQNELASMSPEQRANQAMNMLLYNVYTGPGTKANANLSGNPLFSFLESQINSWAANNIRGVDISFGIDQYDTTTDGAKSTTTSYSYRVSKTLFNDRFKIVVGGNYSTDADADENFAQNLINDISFEYMLNRSGSMYVRLFRHVGYESILEGEITQTGVGFVLKRKLNSLRDLFRTRRRPAAIPTPAITDSINTLKAAENNAKTQ